MSRPNQTHDTLDALLDGRPGEVTDDLAPLLAAAEALRAELADFELDPEVVDRHLEQALDRPATVVTLPVREGRSGLRRRLAAVALAAALVLVPATAASAASASALPGQPLYPVKLAVEQFRLAAVQWSATAEAHERTRLAARRLEELDKLVQLRMFQQVPPAIHRLDRAMEAAEAAITEAVQQAGGSGESAALLDKLGDVQVAQIGELVDLRTIVKLLPSTVLPAASRNAIESAVLDSPAIKPQPSPPLTPAATTVAPGSSNPPPEPSGPATTQPEPATTPQTTEPEPATTPPPTETEPVTTPPPTETPPTTAATEGSPAGAGSDATPTPSTGP